MPEQATAVAGVIPNEYLWYWYYRSDALAVELAADETRGEQIVGSGNCTPVNRRRVSPHPVANPPTPSGSAPDWLASRRMAADSREVTASGERDYDLDGVVMTRSHWRSCGQ